MRTCVCYLEIQQSHGKQGIFVSVAFKFNCGRWKTRFVSEHFLKFVIILFVMNFLKGVASTLLLVDVVLNNMTLSKFPSNIFMRFYI